MELKYEAYLSNIENCPPEDYQSVERIAFRWVHKQCDEQDFIPLNLTKEPPPRILDNSDLHCMGYGLSFFDTHQNAIGRYLNITKKLREHLKNDFVNEKGDCVAELPLDVSDGIVGLPSEQKYGHFTFHESAGATLVSKVVAIRPVF